MDKCLLTRGGAGPAGLPEGEVEIPGVGTVKVRGMNRGELLYIGKFNGDAIASEQYVLSACMLDPQMSKEDVAAWQQSGPAMEAQHVLQKINELSGIGKDAEKSRVSVAGDES